VNQTQQLIKPWESVMGSSFVFEFWFFILLLAILSLAGLYLYYSRKRATEQEDHSYLDGLKYLSEGENRLALEKFKQAVRTDSENIDAYIKIGIILRNEGLLANAIRIHKDLALRGNLLEDDTIRVRQNLVLDYLQVKSFDKAEKYLEELKEYKSAHGWISPYLVQIYEQKGEWQLAFEWYEKSSLARSEEGKNKLAGFKVKQGLQLVKAGDEKAGRVQYKEALKISQKCAPAFLALGDSYWREGRTNDAITAWSELCENIPEKAHYTFDRLEKAWFEKGQFSKLEQFYINLLTEHEDNLEARIALSDIYRKKGEHADAMKLLQQPLKKEVDNELIKVQQIRILSDKNQVKEALNLAMEIVEKKIQASVEKKNQELVEFSIPV
jgi:lipopolysaccharide biosynthesis regulator YciM